VVREFPSVGSRCDLVPTGDDAKRWELRSAVYVSGWRDAERCNVYVCTGRYRYRFVLHCAVRLAESGQRRVLCVSGIRARPIHGEHFHKRRS
jgi:hypothetical protein